MRHALLAGLTLVGVGSSVASEAAQRALSFEDRIKAQEAIERVYYSHQIGATKQFEAAVPRSTLEAKVHQYLDETAALKLYWKTAVTDEMLQRELERMAHGTRMPERLLELYEALGNDPFMIKECLARATLVDRLTRNFYAFDPTLHANARQRAEELRRRLSSGELNSRADHPDRSVVEILVNDSAAEPWKLQAPERLDMIGTKSVPHELSREEFSKLRALLPVDVGQVSAVKEERDAFVLSVLLSETTGEARVASYLIPKIRWDAWWAAAKQTLELETNVAVAEERYPVPAPTVTSSISVPTCADDDTWDHGAMQAPPDGRYLHASVWTGSLMVVWGGTNGFDELNTGGRYDPATDVWTPTSTTAVPSGREHNVAVWTGQLMVIWGGYGSAGYTVTGGRYDPTTDLWTPTSTSGTPSTRYAETAVWAGNSMVVWGGYYNGALYNTGGRYDPATDNWSSMSTAGAPSARMDHTAVVVGKVILIWGGRDNSNRLNTGGRYDTATDTWAPMSATGAPIPRYEHTAIWTGTRMVVWGGNTFNSSDGNTGAQYDPAHDFWTPTSLTDAPTTRSSHTAVWTGSLMVIWGGVTSAFYPELNTGGRYDPTSDTWTPTSTTAAPEGRHSHTAVWTGSVMVVWGGIGFDPSARYPNTGGRYDPTVDIWTPTATTGAPSGRWNHTAVWTGNVMVVWGGLYGYYNNTNHFSDTGGRYDPATDSWAPTATTGAPSPRQYHTALWTGSSMLVWGGFGNAYLDTGGRYDPTTDLWTPISMTGAPSGRYLHAGVWTGTRMVLWGGLGYGESNTGGRYDPSTDTWTPMTTTGAPFGRYHHTALWTGSRMVVWGGETPFSAILNDGGRYDPLNDSWAPTSTLGAPIPRYDHTALWTGTSMVVWGGTVNAAGQIVPTGTGGRYSPASDIWASTSMTGAPTARVYHSAVWTGRQMIVWGGRNGDSNQFNTGARYDPAADTWSPTSTAGAPFPRDSHTAVWTGSSMVVWSGWPDLATGGRYIVVDAAIDHDLDGYSICGGDCDDSNPGIHPNATEVCNGVDDNCDAQIDEDASGVDSDGDGIHNACDNCRLASNPTQSDFDHDNEGDVCDLNDGVIYIYSTDKNYREWQAETGYSTWNSYRGSLAVLRATGQYTQAPGSNPLAARDCGVSDPSVYDPLEPDPGEVAFDLVTGVAGGVESGLGTNSAGLPRVNGNPCP